MKILYTAHATSIGGRDGKVETDDKSLSFSLSAPGSGKPGANPEQLFACGYSACFGSAIAAVARKEKFDVGQVEVKIDVSLNQGEDNGYFLSAALNVNAPSLDQNAAEELVKKAHQVCPYSKATRGNIEVKLSANGKPVA